MHACQAHGLGPNLGKSKALNILHVSMPEFYFAIERHYSPETNQKANKVGFSLVKLRK